MPIGGVASGRDCRVACLFLTLHVVQAVTSSQVARSSPVPKKRTSLEPPTSQEKRKKVASPQEDRTGGEEGKLAKVLASLGQQPGVGRPLARLLQGQGGSQDVAAAFLCFVYERQRAYTNKYRRKEPATANEVIATKWFTNMYRECDRCWSFLLLRLISVYP